MQGGLVSQQLPAMSEHAAVFAGWWQAGCKAHGVAADVPCLHSPTPACMQ